MEITEVVIRPVDDQRLRAYVSLTIENSLVIKDIKIVEGKNGLFVSMPSRRRKNGKYQDIAHPINTDFRKKLEDRIFEEYQKVTGISLPPREIGEGVEQIEEPTESPKMEIGEGVEQIEEPTESPKREIGEGVEQIEEPTEAA